ncbi:MAG: bifunctional aldehyde dehydrogenase/enoyl-CoA hydratase [Smithella sp. PtaU1.Bin162]|nr:MAG: bifunctional aldehyde dehydrogenase/enoyl-CoA hydratase [Smithella sp. PtaU1.Bin162]
MTTAVKNEEKLYFEDIREGRLFEGGPATVSREEIIDFARKYDPQDFHLSDEKARPLWGGLIASGWHTAAICSRLMVDAFISKVRGMGSPGMDEVLFLRPVRPGDTLSGKFTVLELRPSASKADRGFLKLKGELTNLKGEIVFSVRGTIIVARRIG